MSSNIGEPCYKNNQHDGSMTETCIVEKGAKMQTVNGKCSDSTYSHANWIVYPLFEGITAILWYCQWFYYLFFNQP